MKNLDTIFSKDVVITYQDNKVIGENLDYSMIRGTMIISRNVVFTNQENILKQRFLIWRDLKVHC